ncbi:MAG: hypothetical protein B9J98_06735 [Candidatus Terraquivivens tikiterensis]|uniref:Uncharacterized protein n=1 Tax=Candidatus Terraquivivens tikiterensis TaxID=1980982 RepID=A0A2R7Y1G5_9ARCH|nr:MAG: hypothetical protein B9J98_06735 [Candidatus Terraquivivens tikiterensis]
MIAALSVPLLIVQATPEGENAILNALNGLSLQLSSIEDNIMGKITAMDNNISSELQKLKEEINDLKQALTGLSMQLSNVESNVLGSVSGVDKSVASSLEEFKTSLQNSMKSLEKSVTDLQQSVKASTEKLESTAASVSTLSMLFWAVVVLLIINLALTGIVIARVTAKPKTG